MNPPVNFVSEFNCVKCKKQNGLFARPSVSPNFHLKLLEMARNFRVTFCGQFGVCNEFKSISVDQKAEILPEYSLGNFLVERNRLYSHCQ